MSIASFSKPVPAGLRPTGCPVSLSPEPASRGLVRRCFLRTLGVAAMLALTAGSTLRASADDWPQWRGPSRTGVSKEKGWTLAWPKEGPPSLWRTSVGMGYSSFAVADGRVFTLGNTTNTDTLFCFDAASGSSLWSHSYACPLDESTVEGGPLSTPTVDGSRVYTVSRRGHVFCLEADTGKVVWQKQLTDELSVTRPELGFASSPVVEGGALVLNAGGAGTVLDKATGKPLWNPAKGEAGYTTPVVYDSASGRAATFLTAHGVVSVLLQDGKELFRLPWNDPHRLNVGDLIFTTPTSLFVSGSGRGSTLLQTTEGAVVEYWSGTNAAFGFSSSVLVNGHVFGFHGHPDDPNRDLRCVDADTGQVRWRQPAYGLGTLFVADGNLVVLTERGALWVGEATAVGFKPKARAQVLGGRCWTVPVLANGRLYCRNSRGMVVCLDFSGKGSSTTASSDPAKAPIVQVERPEAAK